MRISKLKTYAGGNPFSQVAKDIVRVYESAGIRESAQVDSNIYRVEAKEDRTWWDHMPSFSEEDMAIFLKKASELGVSFVITKERGGEDLVPKSGGRLFTEDEILSATIGYPGSTRATQEKFLNQLGIKLPTLKRIITIEVDANSDNTAKMFETNIKSAKNYVPRTLRNVTVLSVKDGV